MARVFVVQRQKGRDFSSASAHGHLIELLPPIPTIDYTLAAQRLRKMLADFNDECDWLLPAGDPIAISMAFARILDRCGSVPVLKWNRDKASYVEHFITL